MPAAAGGVADGAKPVGETVPRLDALDREAVVPHAGRKTALGPVGVEPEDLEAQALDRLQMREHVGLRAVVEFVERRAQVRDRRRHRAAVDAGHHVREHRPAKFIVAAPRIVAEPPQLHDSRAANRLARMQLQSHRLHSGLNPHGSPSARSTAAVHCPDQPIAVMTPPPAHWTLKNGLAPQDDRPSAGANSIRLPDGTASASGSQSSGRHELPVSR